MHGELSDRTLELSGEINTLRGKLVARNEKIDALEDTLNVRDKYIELLHEVKRDIINQLFRALDAVSRDGDTSNEARSVSKEEIEAEKEILRERLMDEEEYNSDLREAIAQEEEYNRELQSTVQETARENKQLKADFEKREDRLHCEVGNLKSEIDIYELVLRAMDEEVKDLQKQVERLENAETIAQKLDPDTRDKVRSLHQNTS